jgi:hypothetical protein
MGRGYTVAKSLIRPGYAGLQAAYLPHLLIVCSHKNRERGSSRQAMTITCHFSALIEQKNDTLI